jgi:hypothetical protein
MNFKKQAKQLETFLDEEFKTKLPIALLQDGSLGYKDFIVRQTTAKQWNLKRNNGTELDLFNLKVCAIIAAKLYSVSNFKNYNELKNLDILYYQNNADAHRFKRKYTTTQDLDLRDIYVARYVQASQKATYAKKQIASKFSAMF